MAQRKDRSVIAPVPTTPDEASANMVQAFKALATAQTRTLAYADAVEATKHCVRLGMNRATISRLIRESMPVEFGRRILVHGGGNSEEQQTVHKGSGARFIMLARIALAQYLKGETPIVDGVEIAGKKYRDPVEALRAQVTTFSQVYRAFHDAVKPPVRNIQQVPTSVVQSTEQGILSMTVPVRANDDVRRVAITEDPVALATALRVLLASPLARTLLTPAQRVKMEQQLQDMAARAGGAVAQVQPGMTVRGGRRSAAA